MQRIDASMGHYIISDHPMTEEEWIRERASVVTHDKAIEHEPDNS